MTIDISKEALEKTDAVLSEKVISEESIYDGKFFKVRHRQVCLPNGCVSTREMIVHPGASAIVAIDDDGRVVLERQWRSPMDCAFWEIPAGKIDPGEDSFETARRELKEETGLAADDWVELGTIHNAIGYSNERIIIYLARGVKTAEGGQKLDENEFLTLVHTDFSEALAMCCDGRATDVKTVIGLMWAKAYLEGNLPQAKKL